MSFNLIASQGRVADKTSKTIPGAAAMARAIGKTCGRSPIIVGDPTSAKLAAEDDWSVSLPQARDALSALKIAMNDSVSKGNMTVLASNTCPASLASLPVVADHYPDAVILWIDAHGDFNTPETTDSGYLGGMVLAAACGLWDSGHGGGVKGEQVLVVGARDIDPDEGRLMAEAGAQTIPPQDATPEIVRAAVGNKKIWIHIDWDVLEPGYVPADYAVKGGFVPAQLRAILDALPKDQIVGLELAEYQMPDDEAQSAKKIARILEIVEPVLNI